MFQTTNQLVYYSIFRHTPTSHNFCKLSWKDWLAARADFSLTFPEAAVDWKQERSLIWLWVKTLVPVWYRKRIG